MTERTNKIVLIPEEIRGWGNVLKSKASSAFTKYKCTVNQSSSTHDGFTIPTFYINGLLPTILEIGSNTIVAWMGTDDTFFMNVYLKTSRGAVMNGYTVKAYVDNVYHSSATTANTGMAQFTFSHLTKGNKTIKFVYEGATTRGASQAQTSMYIGVNITTSQSNDYYFSEENTFLYATVKKYGLNTAFQGLVNFRLEDMSDPTNVFNFTNVQTDSNGVATLSRQITTPGHYYWTASVDTETSSRGAVYIVDFNEEFNDFLIWYLASTPTGTSSQYEGTIDLRDDFNAYLECLIDGYIDPTIPGQEMDTIELIDGVMQGLHNYYTGG